MSGSEFFSLALQIVRDTILYLLAYGFVPILAFVASVTLQAIMPVPLSERWLRDDRMSNRLLGATILGLTRPMARAEIAQTLRLLHRQPFETIVYLAVSHNLTVYYFFLIGPLLGKDVLLSHVLGGLIFIVSASGLVGLLGIKRDEQLPIRLQEKHPFWQLFFGELSRTVALMAYGLLLGGFIAAWGLSPWTFVPAYVTSNPLLSQFINSLLGGLVSVLLGMWPVANLFVGTYLWKTGLAHAGLVTFFYASPISPHRLRLYAQVRGKAQALRLGVALALAAMVAGLGVAVLFRLPGLSINYKLVPEQLLFRRISFPHNQKGLSSFQ